MRQYEELDEKSRDDFDRYVRDAVGEGLIPEAGPRELWCGRRCSRCGAPVLRELELGDYPYYCPVHDENLFGIETVEVG